MGGRLGSDVINGSGWMFEGPQKNMVTGVPLLYQVYILD